MQLRVLIVENDASDANLLRRAIRAVAPSVSFYIAHDGSEAIEYLQGEGKFANRAEYSFPGIIVTDLKMPRMDGFELLSWLKAHPTCNTIPKIVVSGFNTTDAVVRAYKEGANIFFKKPFTQKKLEALVQLNLRFWSATELPAQNKNKCA